MSEDGISTFQSNFINGFIKGKGIGTSDLAKNLNKFQSGWVGGEIPNLNAKHIEGLLESGKFISLQGNNHFVVVEGFSKGIVKVWDPNGGISRKIPIETFVKSEFVVFRRSK